jgi:hypothetical protein
MLENYNINPYYDDFDETKGFYRVLFKPGFAVQARELTQLQTSLQAQIDRFGKHIFTEGSIVLGGGFDIEDDVDYVRLSPSIDLKTLSTNSLKGSILVGQTTGIRAYVYDVAFKSDWNSTTDVLLVRYLSSSVSSSTFISSETLNVENSTVVLTTNSTNVVGKGTTFTIEEGTIFVKGGFIKFEKQQIILDPISKTPSFKVGFTINENVVNYTSDTSLLDPALGSSNYLAPGADRLRITPVLTKFSLEEQLPKDFFSLFTINNGEVTEIKERTDYSKIYDEFAKRTFDESGNYVVRGFGIRTREYLDTGNNEGYIATSNNTLAELYSTKLAIGVEPGTAYVQGYEVNNINTKYLQANKSLETQNINAEIISARSGNYFILEQVVGTITLDQATVIDLYDTSEQRVSNNITSLQLPSGNKIGTAKVKSFVYEDDSQYRLYIFDVNMIGSNNISQIRSVYTTKFFGDVVLQSGNAVLKETEQSTLLYKVGSNHTRTIRSSNGDIDTTFTFQKTFPEITIPTTGIFNVTVSPTNETHAYGTEGTLSNLEKFNVFLSINQNNTKTLPGTVSVNISTSNTTINGVNTFFTRLNSGDRISVAGVSGYFYVATTPTSDTVLTVTRPFSGNVSSQAISKQYLAGDVIDLTGKGSNAGTVRTVTVLSNKVLEFDLKETFSVSLEATVTINAVRSSAQEVNKILRPSRFVKINCATLSSNTAPINLGFSDVYKLKKIVKKSNSFPTSLTDGTDVTNSFIFNNGQKDDFYDHATITPKIPVSNSDHLVIELDYFFADFTQGVGYFSIDSYPINDTTQSSTTIFTQDIPVYKSSSTGKEFDLRNHLDFRPVKQLTAADATTISGASINPTNTNDFYIKDVNGLRIPTPSSQISCDYSYYLARRDLVVCDKNGTLSIVEGIPSINPSSPPIPETVMGIAKLFIPPYPSLSYTYGRILGKEKQAVVVDNITYSRHTMRDIGALKQRIENLEYYNAVTLLEKNVTDLLILDENGLDRFKNGFFVDGFLDHSLGATYNSDYKISIDKKEGVIRPFFNMNSFKYNATPISLTNLVKTGNLITLPYTEVSLVEQPRVTTTRNIEQSVYRFIGTAELTPDVDNWIDVTVVDKNIELGNDVPPSEILSTEWGSWQTYVTGTIIYNVYSRKTGDRQEKINSTDTLIGSFTSLADAQAAAASVFRAKIEIIDQQTTSKTKTGVQTVVSYENQPQEYGSFVTDFSYATYIRPQSIRIYARGLKANTQFYVFFDTEDMSSYVTPIIDGEAQSEGSVLRSNAAGEAIGFLRLPTEGKRFRTGTKEIVITDNPTNSVDASSYAITYFVANGLNAQKQNTIVSTKVPVTSEVILTENQTIKKPAGTKIQIYGPSCMAYSFKVEAPEGEEGVFLTSAEIFVQAKHPTLGIWFEIREMSPDGGITRTQVPYSEVWYKSNEVTITDDATTPHIVQFPSPVYLLNNTQYAFVIHTEGINPDYYFWISRIGETDIITGNPVTGRPLTGSLFSTNNNLNWNIVPDVDLKVKFNRADFTTGVVGTAVVGNKPYEFLTIETPISIFNILGETITSSQIITLSNVTGSNTITVGDRVQSGNVTQNVVSIFENQYYTDGFNLSANANITILDSTGNTKSITATVSSINTGSAVLEKYDTLTNKIILSDSTGNFFANGFIKGVTSEISSKITSIDEWKYSTVNLKPKSIQLPKTSSIFGIRGVKTENNILDSSFIITTADDTIELFDEYAIKSRSTEIASYSSTPSTQFNAQFSTTSRYVSPIMDASVYNSVFVENLINNDDTNETNPSGGNLLNKYISKIVTLAEGQDAEDLMVMLSAYMPPTTDVKVWMKIINSEDTSETIESKPWIEMQRRETDLISSLSNRSEFLSLTYDVPQDYLTGPNGEVQYTSSSSTFTGFKQFSVKIGLLAQNSAVIPRVGDLKVIALQK